MEDGKIRRGVGGERKNERKRERERERERTHRSMHPFPCWRLDPFFPPASLRSPSRDQTYILPYIQTDRQTPHASASREGSETKPAQTKTMALDASNLVQSSHVLRSARPGNPLGGQGSIKVISPGKRSGRTTITYVPFFFPMTTSMRRTGKKTAAVRAGSPRFLFLVVRSRHDSCIDEYASESVFCCYRRSCYRPTTVVARRRSARAASGNGTSGQVFSDFKIVVFSAQPYVKRFLAPQLESSFPNCSWVEHPLDKETAPLAAGADAVCLFVNDTADAEVAIIDELLLLLLLLLCLVSFSLSLTHVFSRQVTRCSKFSREEE